MEIFTRHPHNEEIPALELIWSAAFGREELACFFSCYYDPFMTIVATNDSVPVSAGYLLPVGNLICDGTRVPCAMIYAVSTLPGFRGCGYGASVTRELIKTSQDSNFPAVALCPSEDSLFEYYSARTGLRDCFYINERRISHVPADDSGAELLPVTVDEYRWLRSDLLKDVPHIEPDMRVLTYQGMLCRIFSGGLYRIDMDTGVSCAVIERQSDDVVWVKELLAPPERETDALPVITAAFPAREYFVRTPVRPSRITGEVRQTPGSTVRRFGMLSMPSASDSLFPVPAAPSSLPWFGFAFD